jgi:hypothetical protein
MTRLRFPLAVLPLAALLALPGAAGALVRIDASVAGVHLGDSPAHVRALLGTPSRVIRASGEFGAYLEYRYRARGVRVSFLGRKHVTNLEVRSRAERTAKGAGLGTSEARLKRLHPGLRCETIASYRSCHTGAFRAGRRVTDFHIRRGVVVRIDLGVVID